MNLDFLKEHYSQLCMDMFSKGEEECAVIHHPTKDVAIKVYYIPDDYTPYTVSFSYQHMHASDPEDVLETVDDYISGRYASVEFFENGKPRFGGDIEPAIILSGDFEALCRWFGYTYGVFKSHSFVLTAWDSSINCTGHFEKNADGKVIFVIDRENSL